MHAKSVGSLTKANTAATVPLQTEHTTGFFFMNKQYKARAFIWGIAGIVIQTLGLVGVVSTTPATDELDPAFAGALLFLIGTVVLSFGLYFYALAKSLRPVWALAGLLCLPGFLLLHFMKDKSKPTIKKQKLS